MSRLLAYLWRFAVVIAGFFCAVVAASAFLHLLLFGGFDWRGEAGAAVTGSLSVSVLVVALIFAYMAFLPAVILVIAAEVFGWRGWLFHALAGGVIGLTASMFTWMTAGSGTDFGLLWALVAAGMTGGLAYWLIAGRSSGLTLDRVVSARERSVS